MEITQELQKFAANPKGIFGKIMGHLMNFGHRSIYNKYISKMKLRKNSIILDIGCGGGKAINMLATMKDIQKIYGIDRSKDILDVAIRLNKNYIKCNKVNISTGKASELKFNNNTFNYVFALETIQFWEPLNKCLAEVYRVIDSEGKLIIINRFPEEHSVWNDFLQLKSIADYKDILLDAGFKMLLISTDKQKKWITVEAYK